MANVIYINWEARTIITSDSELEELIERRVEELKSEITLDIWLDENYFISEVFYMDEEEKREVEDKYEGRLREEAISRIREELIPYEILEYVNTDLEHYF